MDGHPDKLKEVALSGDLQKLKAYVWVKGFKADFTFDDVTPLQHVCMYGRYKSAFSISLTALLNGCNVPPNVINVLLDAGANLYQEVPYSRFTLLHLLTMRKDCPEHFVIALLTWDRDHGSGTLIDSVDTWGYSALERAMYNECYNVSTLLLNHGANCHTRNMYSHSALHTAVIFGNWTMADNLLSFGADAFANDFQNKTPYHYAMDAQRIDLVNLILWYFYHH